MQNNCPEDAHKAKINKVKEFQQKENVTKYRWNHRAKEYKNGTETFNRGVQQQTRCRGKKGAADSVIGEWNLCNQRSKKKKMQKSSGSLRNETPSTVSRYSLCMSQKREKGTERFFNEIMAENFPNLRKDKTSRFRRPT